MSRNCGIFRTHLFTQCYAVFRNCKTLSAWVALVACSLYGNFVRLFCLVHKVLIIIIIFYYATNVAVE